MNVGGIGAFAGGLAGGYVGGANSAAQRANLAATTAATEQRTQALQEERLANQELAERRAAWKAGGMQGPMPTAGDASAPAAASGPQAAAPADAGVAAPAANNELAARLKDLGFHSLAAGIGAQPMQQQEDTQVPMLTQPSGSTGQPNAMSANPALPNLQQIAAQAAAMKKPPVYDKSQVFGA